MATVPDTISIHQLVGYNLQRIRKATGLTQEQAAERLETYLGVRWSKAVYSAAERAYDGKRVRQFTMEEVTAFALAFGVPVNYFLLPPKVEDRTADEVEVGHYYLRWPQLLTVMFGGHQATAMGPRFDELPPNERPDPMYKLAAMGLGSWVTVGPHGTSRYDPKVGEWVKEEGETP
jgi:transcriptional regulator with XRE-family HTH domain